MVPNKVVILYPKDYKHNIDFTKLDEESYYEFNGDIKELLYKLITIFKYISDNSNVVSDTCHVGIYKFQNGETKSGHIKGSANKLLSIIKNGTLSYDY